MHDRSGVDALLRILTRVKMMGWQEIREENIWNHPTPKGLTLDALPSIRQALAESKSCMAALNEITLHVGTRIRLLQRRSAAAVLEEGINLLPDEVLGHVFEMGHLMAEDCAFSLRVSQVSRRFREISLRTPMLWTRLSAHFPDSQTRALITRSGQLDLDISTCVPGTDPAKVEAFLQTVGKHAYRWSRLSLNNEAESLINNLNFTDFPRLSFLYFSSEIGMSEWSTPVLSHIHARNWYATPDVPFCSQLTHLELSYDDMIDVPAADIAETLCCMNSLRELSVTIEECSDVSEDFFVEADDTPERHSVRIEKLKLCIQDKTTQQVAAQVYDALSYLIPTTLDLYLTDLDDEDSFNFITDSAGLLFPNCDISHTVNFEAPMETFIDESYLGHRWSSFSNLRNIRFKHCDRLSEMQVEQLAQNLFMAEEGKGLQSLEIISCRQISEGFLRDLEDKVGDKLVWKL